MPRSRCRCRLISSVWCVLYDRLASPFRGKQPATTTSRADDTAVSSRRLERSHQTPNYNHHHQQQQQQQPAAGTPTSCDVRLFGPWSPESDSKVNVVYNIFGLGKPVPNGHERCSSSCCYCFSSSFPSCGSAFQSTKALTRSLWNFSHISMTIFYIVLPWQIFDLRPN